MAAHCRHDPVMAQCSLLLREIFFALLDIRLDGITARFPASWAHCKRTIPLINNLLSSELYLPPSSHGQMDASKPNLSPKEPKSLKYQET